MAIRIVMMNAIETTVIVAVVDIKVKVRTVSSNFGECVVGLDGPDESSLLVLILS